MLVLFIVESLLQPSVDIIHSTFLFLCSGTHLFCTGNLGPTQYICVAIKNKAIIYELVHSKQRYLRKKEVMVSSPTIHCMMMFNDKLCVGYQSGFSLFNVYLEEPEKSKIVVPFRYM